MKYPQAILKPSGHGQVEAISWQGKLCRKDYIIGRISGCFRTVEIMQNLARLILIASPWIKPPILRSFILIDAFRAENRSHIGRRWRFKKFKLKLNKKQTNNIQYEYSILPIVPPIMKKIIWSAKSDNPKATSFFVLIVSMKAAMITARYRSTTNPNSWQTHAWV